MGCPPIRGDNARALASGYSYVKVEKHDITISYHLHQCRPKGGKGGISYYMSTIYTSFHDKNALYKYCPNVLGALKMTLFFKEPKPNYQLRNG